MTVSPSAEIPSAYNAADVEGRIYENWLAKGYFTAHVDRDKTPFTIIMPPPNVTGELHLGHALTAALEDALCRWHRMLGHSTLWLPGKDHAGIATQWVVEQLLASEGTNRHELGREKFVERVWEWVEKYGNTIDEQHKRLGASCDWSRLRFTLDPGPAKAVRTTFVNLYNKGLIYRHERIINWCPRCATALSDLEVEHQEQDGSLYYIRYPLEGAQASSGSRAGGDGYITVATTRPETMLGDTGVAVNPEDPRYQALVGQQVILPIMDRAIPIVGDSAIEAEFGTGALKVTPGHDMTDFEIGERHGLPIVTVIGQDGNMTEAAGRFAGMERFEARQAVVAELERLGLLEKVENYHHS
ncbi:MAG: class I tRNA ligase family protein, partial [Chloroflexi bacterium]|nr:class I tRNA ligase family protein [Chloroflexota bacterium]